MRFVGTGGDTEPRVLGDEVRALLLAHPPGRRQPRRHPVDLRHHARPRRPAAYGGRTGDPVVLAGLAPELAVNDWQQRESTGRGTVESRNVEPLFAAPPALGGD